MHCLYLFCLPDKLTLLLLCPFLSLVTKFVSKIFLPYTTVGRNINNLRYADDTTHMAESKEELKSLLMKVKEESEKVGLKFSIQKAKIMASGPIISWQIDAEAEAPILWLPHKRTDLLENTLMLGKTEGRRRRG